MPVLISMTGLPVDNLEFISQVDECANDSVLAPEARIFHQVFVRRPANAFLVCILCQHQQYVMLCRGFGMYVAGKLYPFPR